MVRKPLAVGAEQLPKLMSQAAGLPDEGLKSQEQSGFGLSTELKKLTGRIGHMPRRTAPEWLRIVEGS